MIDQVTSRGRQRQPGTKVASSAAPDSYQLTETEVSVIEKLGEQMKAEIPVPQLKKSENGLLDHPNEGIGWALLMKALGTTNFNFAKGVKWQLAAISAKNGEIDESNLNFALSVVAGIKPTDQDEAMLGVLKAASYLCAVKMATHLHNAETMAETDSAERAFNKCARTFAILSETLMRKRSGSERKVTVQSVSVNDNAQAIVGNVSGSKSYLKDK
jgi:hypothetical protein